MTRRNKSSTLRAAVAAGALMLLGACASAGTTPDEAPNEPERAPVVRVENQNWAQVDVYAVREGLSIRLGTVPTSGTETFTLPLEMRHAPDVRLVVEPLASRVGYVSPALTYGADTKLTVANQLSLSTTVPFHADG